jgi:hypothetical protein
MTHRREMFHVYCERQTMQQSVNMAIKDQEKHSDVLEQRFSNAELDAAYENIRNLRAINAVQGDCVSVSFRFTSTSLIWRTEQELGSVGVLGRQSFVHDLMREKMQGPNVSVLSICHYAYHVTDPHTSPLKLPLGLLLGAWEI